MITLSLLQESVSNIFFNKNTISDTVNAFSSHSDINLKEQNTDSCLNAVFLLKFNTMELILFEILWRHLLLRRSSRIVKMVTDSCNNDYTIIITGIC